MSPSLAARRLKDRDAVIESCPFCALAPARIIDRNELVAAIRDAFPVSPGHTLVVPIRHFESFFDLSAAEQSALLDMLGRLRARLVAHGAPEGFTIGINDGAAAGQTVPHVHLHLIPRRIGDVPYPRGGVRWVLPDKARYWE